MHNIVLRILSNCKRFVDQGKVFSGLLTDLPIAQKQPFRGVLKKRCSENIQKIYRRPSPSPCDIIGGRGSYGAGGLFIPPPTFSKIILCQGCFPGNSL